jgi:hypothetical protein
LAANCGSNDRAVARTIAGLPPSRMNLASAASVPGSPFRPAAMTELVRLGPPVRPTPLQPSESGTSQILCNLFACLVFQSDKLVELCIVSRLTVVRVRGILDCI